MTDAPGLLNIRLDDEGRILDDLPCVQCGYNLRTVPVRQQCPECGGAVWTSYHRNLENANPFWLGRLVRGMKWLMAALVVGMVYRVEWMTGAIAFHGFNYWSIEVGPIELLCFVAGVWCVTSREGGEPLEGGAKLTPLAARARYVAIAGVVSTMFLWSVRFPGFLFWPWAGAGIFMTLGLILLGVVLLIACLRSLVQRLPSQDLDRRLRVFMFVIPGSVIGIPAVLIPLSFADPDRRRWRCCSPRTTTWRAGCFSSCGGSIGPSEVPIVSQRGAGPAPRDPPGDD